eukprot:TRINITY_DN1473_c0_g1_i11.p1 TRINITY_DN1473_c0_g1~~TRINITY_DN1473_c0_g1_i11.p1  ORF type:complete len:363 (+),score=87.42 TRINITY_DN1473_c0_g1_i11:894-1982(+)
MAISFKVSDVPLTRCAAAPFKVDGTTFIQGSTGVNGSKKTYSLGQNSFANAAMAAYANHHNLVIRPDDVWIAIMTQFSFYVNANSEALRDIFVDFKGKKDLVVEDFGNIKTLPYDKMARRMEDQIASNIKDPSVRKWVVPDFSTTTETDRVVGAIVLMAGMQNFFRYTMKGGCGLPSVTMQGTPEDWKEIRFRAERLVEFDNEKHEIGEWASKLLPILDQFVLSSEGNPNVEWWNRITHKIGGGSSPTYISGWITIFCMFNQDGKFKNNFVPEEKRPTAPAFRDYFEWYTVPISAVARGYVTVPVTLDDNGVATQTRMVAGHIVADLLDDNTTVVPRLDWFIEVLDGKMKHLGDAIYYDILM